MAAAVDTVAVATGGGGECPISELTKPSASACRSDFVRSKQNGACSHTPSHQPYTLPGLRTHHGQRLCSHGGTSIGARAPRELSAQLPPSCCGLAGSAWQLPPTPTLPLQSQRHCSSGRMARGCWRGGVRVSRPGAALSRGHSSHREQKQYAVEGSGLRATRTSSWDGLGWAGTW
eukprot:SAG11_NODE_4799_length_1763_cov_1.771034_2_plen_175_part_00